MSEVETGDRKYFPATLSLRVHLTAEEAARAQTTWDEMLREGCEHKKEAYRSIEATLNSADVAAMLGISQRTVQRWTDARALLGVRICGDKTYRYPRFQFVGASRGGLEVLPQLSSIRALMGSRDDAFTVSQNFLEPHPGLGGKSAAALLRTGNPLHVATVAKYAPTYGEMGR
jgi:hypothetical protein